MAISGKDIQDCMRELIKFSLAFSLTCVKNHPFASSTLALLLLLYLCFSWLFWLIIYIAGFCSLAASIAKIYFTVSNAKIFKGYNEKNNDLKSFSTRRLVRNDANARSVRRRRSTEPFRDESLETSEEERSTGFSSSVNNVVTVDKTALIEEYPKEIREVQVDSITRTRGKDSALSSLKGWRAKKSGYRKGDRESESSESTEDDERDKKAVQWSEDDQKNMMDLGLSEIERNKRLESLIARRRARKLLSLQVRRTLMNMDRNEPYGRVNPIVVPTRNNPFPGNYSPGQFSPVPGSAPSVLIPRDNPFDLPYDPQEEKPILTGGSFHQDFLPVLQKEMFCRHESFSLGPFFPGEMNEEDQREASRFHFQDVASKHRSFESWENSNLENQSDRKGTDKIIEVESSLTPETKSEVGKDYVDNQDVESPEPRMDSISSHQEENTEEVQTKMMLIDDSSCRPSSASSSELDVPYSRLDKDAILESLAPRLQQNISTKRDGRSEMDQYANDSGLSSLDKDKIKDRPFWTHKGMHHKPSFSIASDLQVEVSEISSPPLTFDGSFSSYDEEGNMERGAICSGEERWAPSPPLSEVDENESRDIHEVTENNAIEIGVSGTMNGEMIENRNTNLHSRSISATELMNRNQNHSEVEDRFQMSAGYGSSHEIPSKPPAYPAPRLTDEQRAQLAPNYDSDKPETSRSMENLQGEFRTAYNTNYSNILQRLNTNSINDEKDIGADLLTREGGRPQKDWSMTSSPTSIGYPDSQFDLIEEHRNMFEYYQPAGENHNSNTLDGRESIDFPQHEVMDESIPVDHEHNTQESIPDDQDHEIETTDDQEFPRFNESLRSRRVSELLPNLIVQQLPFASNPFSSPSPRSVLQPKFSMDQRTLSNFTDDMHAEIQHFYGQIAENNAPNEPSEEIFMNNETHITTSTHQPTQSTEEAKISRSSNELALDNTQSFASPESTAALPETDEASFRIHEEKDKMTEKLHEQEPARGNIESSGSNNTAIHLSPEEETGYRTSKPKHETSEQVRENEAGKITGTSGDETGLEKQQLPKPDHETKSGFDDPSEALSGININYEIGEVDPGVKGTEEIPPENHIAGSVTQGTIESSHKTN